MRLAHPKPDIWSAKLLFLLAVSADSTKPKQEDRASQQRSTFSDDKRPQADNMALERRCRAEGLGSNDR